METFRSVEGETEYRRSLLTEAATGSTRAQQELDREYHVRVYSAQERENYIPPSLPHNLSPAMSRKIDSVVESSIGAGILDRESL